MLLTLIATLVYGVLNPVDHSVVEYISENFEEESTILEFGSGERTDVLAQRYYMHSVEDQIEKINERESTYLYAPIVNGWYDIDSILHFRPEKIDLLLIDGPSEILHRSKIFEHMDLIENDVPILIKGLKEQDLKDQLDGKGFSCKTFDGFVVIEPSDREDSNQ